MDKSHERLSIKGVWISVSVIAVLVITVVLFWHNGVFDKTAEDVQLREELAKERREQAAELERRQNEIRNFMASVCVVRVGGSKNGSCFLYNTSQSDTYLHYVATLAPIECSRVPENAVIVDALIASK